MRLLVCAGGTGGGVYPALAVLQAIDHEISSPSHSDGWLEAKDRENYSVLWVGGIGGMEQDLVTRAGVRFEAIPAAGLHGVGLRALPGNLARLVRGFHRSKQILRDFQPDVLFFTGGYVAGPMALAGRRIPIAVYVPDIEPGLAIKAVAKFADRILVTAKASVKYFSAKTPIITSGYPIRSALQKFDKEAACRALKLETNMPILLVFGGSSGARSINQALMKIVAELIKDIQVIHITGKLDWEKLQLQWSQIENEIPLELRKRYHPYPYLHEEMGAAFSAADLVVARAGASTLGEFPAFGLPAILVPYPYAWRYQKINADYLVQSGAAKLLLDEDLDEKLYGTVRELILDPNQRLSMRQQMQSLAKPEAARIIAKELFTLAAGKGRSNA